MPWRQRPKSDKRLTLISTILIVAAAFAWIFGGHWETPVAALLVGLTNLLGGSWRGLHWFRWLVLWGLAGATVILFALHGSTEAWNAPSILALAATVANVAVLAVRVHWRE